MAKIILVTGGAGYIGSFAIKLLLDRGYDVVVLDSLENGHREAVDRRAKLEVANLEDVEPTKRIFEQYQPEAVLDFAAYLAVGESMESPKKYLDNNVKNFINLLGVMKWAGCKYLVKSSTAAVYGNPDEKYFPLKEDYHAHYQPLRSALLPGVWQEKKVEGERFFNLVLNYLKERIFYDQSISLSVDDEKVLRIPASIYGLTKLMDELIMKKYETDFGFRSVAFRYFNVCGAALDGSMGDDKPVPTNLMTLCFLNILGKLPELSVFGTDYPTKDGTGVRDYIHPLDLATGHLAALEYLIKENQSNTFNLGTGRGYSVFEVIKAIEAASGRKIKYRIEPRRNGDPAVSYSDSSRVYHTLKWRSEYDLKEMAESAWKWHSTHPEGYKMDTGH